MARAATGSISGSRLAALAADAAAALAQRHEAAQRAVARDDAVAAAAAKMPAVGLSLLEMLEIVATQHGLSLLPHARRAPVRGEPVYKFGPVDVFISGGVVYADTSSAGGGQTTAGAFVPISIDALIEKATRAS